MTNRVFCGECGTSIVSGANFCPSCGARQTAGAVGSGPRPRAPESPSVGAQASTTMRRASERSTAPTGSRTASPWTLVEAPLASRLGAYLIDTVIISVCGGLAAAVLLLGAFVSGAASGILAFLAILAFLSVQIVLLAQFTARQGTRNGQTIGKQALGIRTVRADGQPLSVGDAYRREGVWKVLVFYTLGGLLFIPSLLNALWPLWDQRRLALHDKCAETIVVVA